MGRESTGVRAWPIYVVLHGHKDVQIDQPTDVTEFVSEVVVEHGVTPPWDTMQITLQLPKHLFCDVLPGARQASGVNGTFQRRIQTGSWVVVSIEDYNTAASPVAIGFGYVQDINFGMQVLSSLSSTGPQGTVPLTLNCISWLTAAGGSNIRVANQSSASDGGFIYDFQDWAKVISTVLQNAGNANLGNALQSLWSQTSWMIPPTTLLPGGTASFGDQVPVVFNETTAQRWGSGRGGEMLPVTGKYLTSMPAQVGTATLAQWLFSAFNPDTDVVELFPSLEYPPTFTDKDGNARQSTEAEAPTSISTAHALAGPALSAGGNTFTTALGAQLGGAQPIILYRHRPFLLAPINQASAEKWGYRVQGDKKQPEAERIGAFQKPLIPAPSCGMKHFARRYTVLRDEITGMSTVNVSDSRRVNLVYSRNFLVGDAAVRMYDHAGNAVMPSKEDLSRYGLRAFEPVWPYVLDGAQVSGQGTGGAATVLDTVSALNEMFYALVGAGENFANVTMDIRSRPRMRAGHWFKAHIAEDKGNGDLMLHMTGYIERVRHVFARRGTLWTSGTQINAIRCSFSHVEDDYRTPVSAGVRTQTPFSEQQPGAPKALTSVKAASNTLTILDMSKWSVLRLAYMRQSVAITLPIPNSKLDVEKEKGPAVLSRLHPLVIPVVAFTAAQAADITLTVEGRWSDDGPLVTVAGYKCIKGEIQIALTPLAGFMWRRITKVGFSAVPTGKATIYAVREASGWSTVVNRAGADKIKLIQLHHTAGPAGGGVLTAWASRGEKARPGVGAHFAVAENGAVYQYSDPDKEIANAAATTNTGTPAKYFNRVTVAVDLEGNRQIRETPPAQEFAARKLISYLKSRYGIVGVGLASPAQVLQSGEISTAADCWSVADALSKGIAVIGHNRILAKDACPGRKTDVPALALGVSTSPVVKVIPITNADKGGQEGLLQKLYPEAFNVLKTTVVEATVGKI